MAAHKKNTQSVDLRIDREIVALLKTRAESLNYSTVNAYAVHVLTESLGTATEKNTIVPAPSGERDIDLRALLLEALRANAEANRKDL